MANILATVTEDARKYWPMFFGTKLGIVSDNVNFYTSQDHWNPLIKYFRVGEGGWINSTATPRVPQYNLRRTDNLLGFDGATSYQIQDIDCVVDRQRAPADYRYGPLLTTPGRGWFEKALNPLSDFTFSAPHTIQIRCLLDFSEFNDTYVSGSATTPTICELALYADHPLVTAGAYFGSAKFPLSPTEYNNLLPVPRLMIAYGTFPAEVKDSTKQIEHLVQLLF